MPKVVDETLEGRDPKTPFYAHLGVAGIIALAVILILAIAFPLYYAFGGK
jgi:hypothetical protein